MAFKSAGRLLPYGDGPAGVTGILAAKLIDGKALAQSIRDDVSARASALRAKGHVPSLVAVIVGDDAAALSYARSQSRHADATGIEHRLIELPASATQPTVRGVLEQLSADDAVDGIMLHLPVPRPLDAFSLQQCIAPQKDVEGVGAGNLGLLAMGRPAMAPCTAAAAFACLRSAVPDLAGREAVVIGRSVIVGKPLAMLLLAANATVTQCHTRTRDLASHARRAELLLVAAGVPGLIGGEHVSPGAVVIDVGTHRVPASDAPGETKMKTIGDVRFDEVAGIASQITPVPGGVGPVTVAMLLENTVAAAERRRGGTIGEPA